MKISFFSKEQQFKQCMLQLAKEFNLPLDIIKLIYNYKRIKEGEDQDEIRLFYKNIILLLTLDTHENSNHTNVHRPRPSRSWAYKYKNINDNYNLMTDDIYNYRLPQSKGVEWAINHSYLKKKNNNMVFSNVRSKLIYEINIIGEGNYLMDENPEGHIDRSCGLKKKILYLNTSPWVEVICDYESYLDNKGTLLENHWRLVIDNSGDSYYI